MNLADVKLVRSKTGRSIFQHAPQPSTQQLMNHKTFSRKAKLTLGAGIIAFALSFDASHAAITLSLTDNDGNPTVAQVEQGSPFTVKVTLTSTAELTTGLSYFLEENSAGNPHLKIIARDITGSLYSELTSSNGAVLGATASLLNPRNDFDLGAGIEDLNSPLGAGSYFVANITLLVLPTTPVGTYTLAFSTNSVAAGAGPNFAEIPVSTLQYSVVAQVPEPASALLLAAGGFLFTARSRRRSVG
jgi:hypothetical protein